MNTNEPALNDGLDIDKEIEFIRNCFQNIRHGVKKPTLEEMPDGYWVPWHVVDMLLINLQEKICETVSNAELRRAADEL